MQRIPIIYNIDVDDHLCEEVCWTEEECLNATPVQEWIDWVNKKYETDYIVICTARRHSLYLPTIKWLEKHGVHYHNTCFSSKPPGTIVDRRAINQT